MALRPEDDFALRKELNHEEHSVAEVHLLINEALRRGCGLIDPDVEPVAKALEVSNFVFGVVYNADMSTTEKVDVLGGRIAIRVSVRLSSELEQGATMDESEDTGGCDPEIQIPPPFKTPPFDLGVIRMKQVDLARIRTGVLVDECIPQSFRVEVSTGAIPIAPRASAPHSQAVDGTSRVTLIQPPPAQALTTLMAGCRWHGVQCMDGGSSDGSFCGPVHVSADVQLWMEGLCPLLDNVVSMTEPKSRRPVVGDQDVNLAHFRSGS